MAEGCELCGFIQLGARGIILENNGFFSVYDQDPVTEGHALVIPKRHVVSFLQLRDGEPLEMYECITGTQGVIEARYNPDGLTIGVNIGEAAGQTQNHMHVHLIPRYTGDVEDPTGGVRGIIPGRGNYLKF